MSTAEVTLSASVLVGDGAISKDSKAKPEEVSAEQDVLLTWACYILHHFASTKV